MLALAMVLISLGFAAFGLCWFFGWVLKEHILANRYRQGERRSVAVPTPAVVPETPFVPSWRVTFKDGSKTSTVVVSGPTEAEALRSLIKNQTTVYGNIVSSVRI